MIKTYKIKGTHKGIDDLESIYAFHGNSQGDDSVSNDVNKYVGSQGWMSVSLHFKDINYLNQDKVNKRSLEIQKENDKYIKSLHKSGEYNTYNGDLEFTLKYCPMHDDPSPVYTKSLESYRMVFFDFSKND